MALLNLATAGIALLLLLSLMLVIHVRQLRETMTDCLQVLAPAISQVGLHDGGGRELKTAQQLVAALAVDEAIELATVYDAQGMLVASHRSDEHAEDSSWSAPPTEDDGSHFFRTDNSFHLMVSQSIRHVDGTRLGRIVLVASLTRIKNQESMTAAAMLFGVVLFFTVNYLVARRLQRSITDSVARLAATVRRITELGDYAIRVERGGRDEIGGLIDHFNSMLDAIQIRDRELHQHRHNLELLVEERTEELRRRRDEALAASQAKTEFLANMSHEIRTPMNGVIGVLSLLKDAPLNDDYHRLLETAVRSADSLMHIINDILDFSKIDAGMIEFESIPFDVGRLTEEVASLYVDAVNHRNIDLLCYIPPDLQCLVDGDPTRLRQILTNLLSNAVKFTEAGQILLRIESIEVQEQKQLLRFVVKDSGVGIPEKQLPRLFEKFTQADGSITRQYGGTGLGLSVCKQLVELQGGDIGVYSRVKEGTEFWFTMPFKISGAKTPAGTGATVKDELILLVIGSRAARLIVESYLIAAGARVACCLDVLEAHDHMAEAAQHGRFFDAIILDGAFLDEPAGRGFLDRVADHEEGTRPRLILFCRRATTTSAMPPGTISAVVYQPLLRTQLIEAMNGTAQQDQLCVAEPSVQATQRLPPGTILLVDDEPINRKVACALLERFGLVVHTAAHGREAIERAAEQHYDIILMDIQMPEMSGYEATERIRGRESAESRARSVIIAMTANALKSTKLRCLQAGMDDFISKPISPDMLAERLRPWLSGGRENQEKSTKGDENPGRNESVVWDRDEALQLVGGDPLLLNDLIRLFLERKDLLLDRVERAIAAGDPAQLDDAAHALKGALNHFCAPRAHQRALLLEMRGKKGDLSDSREIYCRLATEVSGLAEQLSRAVALPDGIRDDTA